MIVDPALPAAGSLAPVGLTSPPREEEREIIPKRAACNRGLSVRHLNKVNRGNIVLSVKCSLSDASKVWFCCTPDIANPWQTLHMGVCC